MRFERLDPPGTWLQSEALFDLLARHGAGPTFLEVGCGEGGLSRRLIERGFRGVGIDASSEAAARAAALLKEAIGRGWYEAHARDLGDLPAGRRFDFGIAMMVVEHVVDEIEFVRRLASHVRPSGLVILGVPGRRDHWSIEDETVGHLRRYEKADLAKLLQAAGLEVLDVWSAAVPVANLLFGLGNRLVARSESEKLGMAPQAQTLGSGIRDVPFKTTFPWMFRLVLNRWTMLPLAVLQRAFYRSALGITLIGCGRVPARG